MTTLEEVRAVTELCREEARALRGRQSDAHTYGSQAPDHASALEHIWHRLGLHSVATSSIY